MGDGAWLLFGAVSLLDENILEFNSDDITQFYKYTKSTELVIPFKIVVFIFEIYISKIVPKHTK